MATIYAKNKNTGEWERVGPAAAATDATLTLSGSPADAKATGEAINEIRNEINNISFEGLATEEYVNERITEVVGGAPELLNTLDELSAALNDDENFATTVANQIAEKQDKLTFDETPTKGSVNPVTSDGIKSYIDAVYIPFTINSGNCILGDNYTYANISSMLENNKTVLLYTAADSEGITKFIFKFNIKNLDTDKNMYFLQFDLIQNDGASNIIVYSVFIYEDNTGTFHSTRLVPNGRKINGKNLSADIVLTAEDVGALQSYTETDPTVPDWAKAESKPSYDFSEITVTDTEAAKVALDIENGMIMKELHAVMPTKPYVSGWSSVVYGDNKFVAMRNTTAYRLPAYSMDGITWENSNYLPSAVYCKAVTYGDGKFVAVPKDSDITFYSTDGITWNSSTMPQSGTWMSITYSDGKFVAVASGSDIAAYSTDGINWIAATLPSSASWYGVTYGNGKFVAVAYNTSTVAYSTDGVTWNSSTMPESGTWMSIAYGDGKFVTAGNKKVAYSTDGITWNIVSLPSSINSVSSITYGDGKFIVTPSYNTETNVYTTVYSTDGIVWNSSSSLPITGWWHSATYGDGKFVVVSGNENVIFSYDGITWYDSIQYISQNDTDVTADTLAVLKHTHDEYLTEQVQADLSQTDSTQIDYVKGIIRKESLPEGYPYKEQSELVIEWDGNTEGLENVGMFYRVSSEVFTDEQIKAGVLEQNNGQKVVLADIWEQMVSAGHVTNDVVVADFSVFARKDNAAFSMNGQTITLPYAGVYFFYYSGSYTAKFSTFGETIHPMAPEFLPETLATQEYVDIRVPAWTDADEGKILRIVNGVPTWATITNAEGSSY